MVVDTQIWQDRRVDVLVPVFDFTPSRQVQSTCRHCAVLSKNFNGARLCANTSLSTKVKKKIIIIIKIPTVCPQQLESIGRQQTNPPSILPQAPLPLHGQGLVLTGPACPPCTPGYLLWPGCHGFVEGFRLLLRLKCHFRTRSSASGASCSSAAPT